VAVRKALRIIPIRRLETPGRISFVLDSSGVVLLKVPGFACEEEIQFRKV